MNTAISPIDGRYHQQTECLSEYFSESALIRYRIKVEVEYLIFLSKHNDIIKILHEMIDESTCDTLRSLYTEFNETSVNRVKEIEKITNHDIKAVEYYINEQISSLVGYEVSNFLANWIHFGLTSQDINNTAIPASIKDMLYKIYIPRLENLLADNLQDLVLKWKDIPMLSHTHGQPATPTRVGKEIMVFYERINNQLNLLKNIELSCKFGGATGQFNAHYVALPHINWNNFADDFIHQCFGLKRQRYTTQIEHYDMLAALMDNIRRINVILIDFCRDIWMYISKNYFIQKYVEGEIGSSTMPHKINPIYFENAEGNLGIANSLFEHMSNKLPISRMQRDLSDSTVLRGIGVPFAHTIISINSIIKGISRIEINQTEIRKDLANHWEVISEGLQMILRREGYKNSYEALHKLMKNKSSNELTKEFFHNFIDNLDNISSEIKYEMKQITPFTYIGIFNYEVE